MSGKRSKPAFRKGASADNPDRLKDKGDTFKRSRSTINRLNMYRGGQPIRNREGVIVGGTLMSRDKTGDKPMGTVARIAPNRKWFGNTRVIAPQALDKFREELGAKVCVSLRVVAHLKARHPHYIFNFIVAFVCVRFRWFLGSVRLPYCCASTCLW